MIKAGDVIDAEWESLKDLPVGEVIDYLTGLGYPEEEARKAVKDAGFAGRKEKLCGIH